MVVNVLFWVKFCDDWIRFVSRKWISIEYGAFVSVRATWRLAILSLPCAEVWGCYFFGGILCVGSGTDHPAPYVSAIKMRAHICGDCHKVAGSGSQYLILRRQL